MKQNKRYRFLMVQARLEAEQHHSDGAAIKFLQATLNIDHGKAVSAWFNYELKNQVCGFAKGSRSVYQCLVDDLDNPLNKDFPINKRDRTILIFGKPTPIFVY